MRIKGILKLTALIVVIALAGSYAAYNVYRFITPQVPLAPIEEITKIITHKEVKTPELTICRDGYAIVKEYREVIVSLGVNEVKITNLPKTIDFESIVIEDSTDARAEIIEVSYCYDVNLENLLEKVLGNSITVVIDKVNVTGQLVSYSPSEGLILKVGENIHVLKSFDKLIIPSNITYLEVKPTILCKINATIAGKHELEISYLIKNISWYANYVLVLGEDNKVKDFKLWAVVNNHAGKEYKLAKVTLMDYNLHPILNQSKSFGNLERSIHGIYKLKEEIEIPHSFTKQILLHAANNVSYSKEYVADWEEYGNTVQIVLLLNNSVENNLGITLPKGSLKLFKEDNGVLQLIKVCYVNSTEKGELMKIPLKEAQNIMFNRRQCSCKVINGTKIVTYELKLKNLGEKDTNIVVLEHVCEGGEVINATHRFTKTSVGIIEFHVNLKPHQEEVIVYEVMKGKCVKLSQAFDLH